MFCLRLWECVQFTCILAPSYTVCEPSIKLLILKKLWKHYIRGNELALKQNTEKKYLVLDMNEISL